MATSFPLPSRPRASRRACPPAPKVASTTVSPGSTARSSQTSSASTGTCASAPLLCKTFGNIVHPPFDGVEVLGPGVAVPDLEVVVDTDDDDLALEPRPRRELGRHEDAALLVGQRVDDTGEEESLQLTGLARKGVEPGQTLLDDARPALAWIHVEVRVDALADHDAAPQQIAKPRRQREPALLVDRMLVFAEEHDPYLGGAPTLRHFTPLHST